MNIKNEICKKLALTLNKREEFVEKTLQKSPKVSMGDYSLPCFQLAKELKKSPIEIANDLQQNFKSELVEKTEVVAGYLNIFIKKEIYIKNILEQVNEEKNFYGSTYIGDGKKALIEHTSINPNASPHIGRARNALIGDSIVRLLKFNKYNVETHYFVNDIGKQISMLIVGADNLEKITFDDLLKVYVDINSRIKESPELEKIVFENLNKLEHGDKDTIAKFRKVVGICIEGQRKILAELGIKYDYFDYESEFIINKDVDEILELLQKSGKLFETEEGTLAINQEGYNLPIKNPLLVITRADKTTLYPLRDIAYSLYKNNRAADRNIMVLGEDQKTYFLQIKSALDILGYNAPEVIHYSFVLLPEGKMSTRNGQVVLLEDFMKEILNKAKQELKERTGEVDEEKAKAIAYGAVKYTILKCSPEKTVTFNLETALSFEGDTSLYIQYNYARICSILSKSKIDLENVNYSSLKEDIEIDIIQKIEDFKNVISRATEQLTTSLIANYVYDLTKTFSSYYHDYSILNAETPELINARLVLANSVATIIKNSLSILGIDTVESI